MLIASSVPESQGLKQGDANGILDDHRRGLELAELPQSRVVFGCSSALGFLFKTPGHRVVT